jgi:hypothetical protein
MGSISENCRENGKTYFMFSALLPKIVKLMTYCGKILYSPAGHRQYLNNTVHALYEMDK